ncbi:hypothetical protein DL93DRAFT_2172156 [Clavulina sp. PMI_390]|nr:hypothetical protein DL93DRAFT_2172156 [Clavulina sp. PMI_390]
MALQCAEEESAVEPYHITSGTRIAVVVPGTEQVSADDHYTEECQWDIDVLDLNYMRARRSSQSCTWPRSAQAALGSQHDVTEDASTVIAPQATARSKSSLPSRFGTPQFILTGLDSRKNVESLASTVGSAAKAFVDWPLHSQMPYVRTSISSILFSESPYLQMDCERIIINGPVQTPTHTGSAQQSQDGDEIESGDAVKINKVVILSF